MHAPFELVDDVQHRCPFGLGFWLEVDRDLGIEPRAAGLANATSLYPFDCALDRLAIAHPRPSHVDVQFEIAFDPVLEDLQMKLSHSRDECLTGLFVDPKRERRVFTRAVRPRSPPAFPCRPS